MRRILVLSALLWALLPPCTALAQAPMNRPPTDPALSATRQATLQAPRLRVIPGPVVSRLTVPPRFLGDGPRQTLEPELFERGGPNWKTGVIVGATLGILVGITVASWEGDEGSDRSAGDRISSGLIAGGIVAVPATVIFALLFGAD